MTLRRPAAPPPRTPEEADFDDHTGEEAEKQKIREEVTDAPPPAAPPRVRDLPGAPPAEKKTA